jgi:hypothetical protein
MIRSRGLAFAGTGVCCASLVLIPIDPRAALGGWLVGFAFWSSVPIGALGLLMMMKLIPGPWREELMPWTERALVFLPLSALTMLPILLGEHSLYGWAGLPMHGFRAIYLATWSFALRSVLFFTGAIVLAVFLLGRPAIALRLSVAGLLVFVLFDTTILVDWLMSLEPDFHSSGFGLYGLAIQFTVAVTVIIGARLLAGGADEHIGILGGLLITMLLLSIYLAFMQFFITWSDNLREGVKWYEQRGEGIWTAVLYAAAACHLAPLFLLFFPPIRQSRSWLLGLCLAILIGKALELGWLVLPIAATLAVGLASAVLALTGIVLLAAALPPLLLRRAMVPS